MSLEATFFDSYNQLILTWLILFMAQTVYVLFGFGLGLIAVGLLALFIQPVTHVIVLLLFVAIPAEIYVVYRSWRSISWQGIVILSGGIVVGTVIGTLILKYGNPEFILTILGFFLIGAGMIFLIAQSAKIICWPSWCPPFIGVVAGLLAGMFGTGGPPLIFYYQLSGLKKEAFRGNLMTLFLLMALVRFPSYAFSGLVTFPRFLSAVYIFPAILLGIWLGNRIHVQISETGFRKMVSAGLIVIGIILLIKQFH
ncbi:MAG: sulfite exporter TauE/SafE family protein [Deltaproteobacteria bacterium]|nr:sulfite exporter TauE/SafE family protein [Deltaproteobacteria bacterium]